MDAPLPKQYLLLAGQPMLIHTLEALLAEPAARESGSWPTISIARASVGPSTAAASRP